MERIEYLYRELRDRQVDDEPLGEIMTLVQSGKRRAVERALLKKVSGGVGQTCFKQSAAPYLETII